MNSVRLTRLLVALGVIISISLTTALGQSGTIQGKVFNNKCVKVIVGATVTITNPKTAIKKKFTTDDKGYFTATPLPPGSYTIIVEKDGYQRSERAVILETGGRVLTRPIDLQSQRDSCSQALRAPGGLYIVLTSIDDSANRSGPHADAPDGAEGLIVATSQSSTQTASSGSGGSGTQNQPAPEKLDAGRLQLQLLSGERSDLVTNNQVRNLALNGRDIIEFLKLMPGIVSDFNGQISNPEGLDKFFINGTRGNQHELLIDGSSNVDTGSNGSRHVTLNPDAVAEIKVLTANYQAEYGKAAGGFIQIVTKSGTTELHGGARFFHRQEGLNANNFFNNAQGRDAQGKELLPRPLYRYNTFGYDIGGPVYLPRFGEGGHVAKRIKNLFFFVNQEFYRQLVPNPQRSIRVPTMDERNGDFNNSINQVGNKVYLLDPSKAGSCGPENTLARPGACFVHNGRLNVIPPERFFQGGRILNLYPLPNTEPTEANFQRNYLSQSSTSYPRSETIARFDYKLSEQTDIYGRVIHNRDQQTLPYGLPGALDPANAATITFDANPNSQNFDRFKLIFPRPGLNLAFTVTQSFGQTVTSEFIFGYSRNRLKLAPEAGTADGRDFPLLFPNANTGGLLPNFVYGAVFAPIVDGVSSAVVTRGPETAFVGLPFKSYNQTLNLAGNLTKVWDSHLVKIGLFIQGNRKEQTVQVLNNGRVTFALEGPNPLSTGHVFANALIGNFLRYEQASNLPIGFFRYRNIEGYIQDLWRVNDRLVFDLGLRLSWYQPQYDARQQTAFFNPELFAPAKAVRLYLPTCVPGTFQAGGCAAANQRAYDPANPSALLPANLAGRIVPGSGDPLNGIAPAGRGYLRGGIEGRGVQWGPRVGFAYDLLGDGSTILRGGFGIFYDRIQGGVIADMLKNPPTVVTRVLENGSLQNLTTATELPPTPQLVYGIARDGKIPNVYSFSLNLQRDIGWETVVDVAYVGTLGRHLVQGRNLNAVPYLTSFQQANQDPAKFAGGVVTAPESQLLNVYADAGLSFTGRFTKATNFLRPYPGYSDIRFYEFGGSSNYHSLQASLRRRFSRNLTLSLAYTWSRAFATANNDLELTNPFNQRAYDYRRASYDRTHVFDASYVYSLPQVSPLFGRYWLAKSLFDNWQISGITQFSSGRPFELERIGSSANRFLAGTLSGSIGPLFYVRGNPQAAPQGLQVNPQAFFLPKPGEIKPWPRTFLSTPGINNWDISIFKNIPLGTENRSLQLRLEMFNAFNHTQFTNINGEAFNLRIFPEPNDPLGVNLVPYVEFLTRRGIYRNYLDGRTEPPRPIDEATKKSAFGRLFGEYSSARDPRIIQLAVKLYF